VVSLLSIKRIYSSQRAKDLRAGSSSAQGVRLGIADAGSRKLPDVPDGTHIKKSIDLRFPSNNIGVSTGEAWRVYGSWESPILMPFISPTLRSPLSYNHLHSACFLINSSKSPVFCGLASRLHSFAREGTRQSSIWGCSNEEKQQKLQ
jgi:hypothetical protein